mmetsp:Transcript_14613/g.48999  ORF Transcript_14613/g.48999 Transcript_14613/m.48999 type:complete len:208 (-) Transcript_14613:24-647(-)
MIFTGGAKRRVRASRAPGSRLSRGAATSIEAASARPRRGPPLVAAGRGRRLAWPRPAPRDTAGSQCHSRPSAGWFRGARSQCALSTSSTSLIFLSYFQLGMIAGMFTLPFEESTQGRLICEMKCTSGGTCGYRGPQMILSWKNLPPMATMEAFHVFRNMSSGFSRPADVSARPQPFSNWSNSSRSRKLRGTTTSPIVPSALAKSEKA